MYVQNKRRHTQSMSDDGDDEIVETSEDDKELAENETLGHDDDDDDDYDYDDDDDDDDDYDDDDDDDDDDDERSTIQQPQQPASQTGMMTIAVVMTDHIFNADKYITWSL